MAFFNQFPKRTYDLLRDGKNIAITDTFRNVDVNEKLIDTISSYQYYTIKDGERPDHVSTKLYNNAGYYWSFFIVNDHLKKGYSSWPMSYTQFDDYMNENYRDYAILELEQEDFSKVASISNFKDLSIGFEFDSPLEGTVESTRVISVTVSGVTDIEGDLQTSQYNGTYVYNSPTDHFYNSRDGSFQTSTLEGGIDKGYFKYAPINGIYRWIFSNSYSNVNSTVLAQSNAARLPASISKDTGFWATDENQNWSPGGGTPNRVTAAVKQMKFSNIITEPYTKSAEYIEIEPNRVSTVKVTVDESDLFSDVYSGTYIYDTPNDRYVNSGTIGPILRSGGFRYSKALGQWGFSGSLGHLASFSASVTKLPTSFNLETGFWSVDNNPEWSGGADHNRNAMRLASFSPSDVSTTSVTKRYFAPQLKPLGTIHKIDTETNQVWIKNPSERLINSLEGQTKHSFKIFDTSDNANFSPAFTPKNGWGYGDNATAYYKDSNDRRIGIYDSPKPGLVTYREFEEAENEKLKSIRIVKPDQIGAFADLYKTLINE